MKIRSYLILGILFCVIIPIFIVSTVAIKGIYEEAVLLGKAQLKSIAQIQTSNLEMFFLERENDIDGIQTASSMLNFAEAMAKGEKKEEYYYLQTDMTRFLKNRTNTLGYIKKTDIADNDGIIIASNNPDTIGNSLLDELEDISLHEGEYYVSNIMSNSVFLDGDPFFAIMTPIIFSDKNIGRVVQIYDTTFLDKMAQDANFMNTGRIIIVDKDAVPAGLGNSKETKGFISYIDEYNPDETWIAQIKKEDDYFVTKIENSENINYLSQSKNTGWSIISSINKKELTAGIFQIIQNVLIVVILSICVVTVLYMLMYNKIMSPIARLKKFIDNIKDDNYSSRYMPEKNNEISQIGEALNRLMETVERRTRELSESEKELLESEEKFKRVLTTSSSIIFEADLQKDEIYSDNPSEWMDFHGIEIKKEYSVHTLEVAKKVLPEYRKDFLNLYSFENIKNLILKGGREFYLEYQAYNKNNEIIWCSGTILPVKIGTPKGIIGYVKNIDQYMYKRDLEDERAISKAKSLFFANVSHEIRTPINAITGMLHFLKKTDIDNKQSEYIRKIEHASDLLLSIVNDILDLTKINEEKNIIFLRSTFNLFEVTDNIIGMFSDKCQTKNIGLHLDYIADKDILVKSDKLRMTQVIMNIISNAVKFTDVGEIRITVENIGETDTSITYKITVADTGMGMSVSNLSKVWSEFKQAENVLTKNTQGTGLGLPISKNIVEQLGGKIWANSVLGAGSVFMIEITFEKSAYIDTHKQNKSDIEIDMKGKKILLLEDNEVNAEIVKMLIEDLGMECDVAEDGILGLEKCKSVDKDYYDLILTDIHMPKMDGYEFSKAAKEYGVVPPLIALTATVVDDDIRNEYKNIISDYLIKPIKPDELGEKIKEWLMNND